MNDDEKRFLEQIQKQNESAHAETRRQVRAELDQMEERNAAAHAETGGSLLHWPSARRNHRVD